MRLLSAGKPGEIQKCAVFRENFPILIGHDKRVRHPIHDIDEALLRL